ncbi:MAG: NAD/NADP octopine/nopaline dehydrogenase family protein [Candidatus Atribacteria bacterium]|nr:NAD/NADP octopine/nopaline dehydrogenase family protein [Candidatus Atribacteria bacterium]
MKNNNIAVLGGGHGAHTMAADLVLRGFKVRMFELEEFIERMGNLPNTKKIQATGLINGVAKLEMVTSDIEATIADVKYIAIVTPSFAHEAYAKILKGKVNKDQIIILYPGAFSSLVFRNILGSENCPVIAETNNLPYDTRLKGAGKVFVSGINPINIAFLPSDRSAELIDEMRELHPFEKVYEDVLECGLSIVNPSLHSGACLLNIGAIEQPSRGDFYLYEHFTPGAAKVDLAIDLERKAIGEKIGYKLRPIEDFAHKPEGYNWKWQDLYMQMHGDVGLTPISGPDDIYHRYLTEDCPFGLVPWSSLAKVVGVKTPVIDAIINLYCLIHERNWWEEGRKLNNLGIENMTVDEIKRYVKSGKKIK